MSRLLSSRNALLVLISAVIWIAFAAVQPSILSATSLRSMVVLAVEVGVIALGQTFVIISGGGGIDLSVGSIFALSSVTAGLLMTHGVAWPLAALTALLAGLGMGALNGVVIVALRIPPLMTTLATLFGYSGVALILSGGVDISGFPKGFFAIGQSRLLEIPVQFLLIYLPILLILLFVERASYFGRALYLSGTNETAARLSGIEVGKIRFLVYALSGLLSGVAGIVNASRLTVARPDAGGSANLVSITIAVLGGANIFGGEGSVVGTALASLAIGSVTYGLSYVNANPVFEGGIVGGILIFSVLAQGLLGRLQRARA